MITIKEVRTKRDRKQFVKLPWPIYKDDPAWVPPLISERMDFLNPKKNPYYRHSRVQLITALCDGEPAGRLSVHENIPHVTRHNEKAGFFGFFECIDDRAVANKLFDYASAWLRDKGYSTMRGPFSFSINGEYALLVDGFEHPPMVMMAHNPPYYGSLIEQYGFKGSQDMYAYRMDVSIGLPDTVLKKADEVEKKYENFHVRKMNLKYIEREAKIVHKIYTEAWDENWGAVPLNEKEIMALAKELKMVIDEDITFVAELDGEPIGFSLFLPDINQAIKRANGRLLPVGLIKLLLKKRSIDAFRAFAMGVLKEHRHRGFDNVFYKRTFEEGRKKGYRWTEMSLINESNKPMRTVLERIGAQIYKTYRMYDLKI
ncbi:MAG: GNAT family N-acetyltransferase [Patescibacteria group bacterium]